MVQAIDLDPENQRHYQKLMVALEASANILNLLIAVCDDRNLRGEIIQAYEAELKQQDIRPYRVRLEWQEPSLRSALQALVHNEPDLQQQPAIVTVLGIDDLLVVRLGAERSEQDRFFFSLQWTRESLREFHHPIVLWLTESVLVRLATNAPDFWSWRGGVFWFTGRSPDPLYQKGAEPVFARSLDPIPDEELPLDNLLSLIKTIAAQNPKDPLLATLYDSLGQAYERRIDQGRSIRQLAVAAYEQAIDLQTELGLESDLIYTLRRQGNLYFTLKDDVNQAIERYQQSFDLAKKLDDRLGEANCLQAIADVLQFQKRSSEALVNYEQALSLYRDIGARLGEANCLQAIADVLQFQDRYSEALVNYEQALSLYRDIGARLGEANCLQAIADVLQFQKRSSEALVNYEQALSLYRDIGARLGEANCLQAIADVLQFQDRYSEALVNYEQALSLYRDIGARLGEANCLKAIADVLQSQKEYVEALANYEQALSLYRKIGDRLGEANALCGLGDLQFSQAEYQESLGFYRQSLALAEQIGDQYSESRFWFFIGRSLAAHGQKLEAVAAYQTASEIVAAIGLDNLVEFCQSQIQALDDEVASDLPPSA
jgi:tetratricopeptide (TPR) repeat protein